MRPLKSCQLISFTRIACHEKEAKYEELFLRGVEILRPGVAGRVFMYNYSNYMEEIITVS